MNFNVLFEDFKTKCKTVRGFTHTTVGKRLFVAMCVLIFVLFFAPLFHGAVGAAIAGCVAAPFVVLLWRKYDKPHAVVPAVLFCIPMILDMLFYGSLQIASTMLVAMIGTLCVALHPNLRFFDRIKDTMYMLLAIGGICVAIVIVASLITLLVSIAWWLFCLVAFLGIVAIFVAVVLSTAAYTASDGRRQAKRHRAAKMRDRRSGTGDMYNVNDYRDIPDDTDDDTDTDEYADTDDYAEDVGYDMELFAAHNKANTKADFETSAARQNNRQPRRSAAESPDKKRRDTLYYDVD